MTAKSKAPKKVSMSAADAAAIRAKADKILLAGGLKKLKSTPVVTAKTPPPALPAPDQGEPGAAGKLPHFAPVEI